MLAIRLFNTTRAFTRSTVTIESSIDGAWTHGYECTPFNILQVQHLYVTHYEPIKRHLQPLLGFTF